MLRQKDRNGLRYGYLWWVYPAANGFAALGLDGQTILVLPRKNLAIAFTASRPDHGHKAVFPCSRAISSRPRSREEGHAEAVRYT